jgi:hypothetical protein
VGERFQNSVPLTGGGVVSGIDDGAMAKLRRGAEAEFQRYPERLTIGRCSGLLSLLRLLLFREDK